MESQESELEARRKQRRANEAYRRRHESAEDHEKRLERERKCRERFRQAHPDYYKRYYAANREKRLKAAREYYAAHKFDVLDAREQKLGRMTEAERDAEKARQADYARRHRLKKLQLSSGV